MSFFSNRLEKVRYVFRLCKKRQSEGELSAIRQLVEIAVLLATRGIGYNIYHFAGMYERSASWKYKCSYLSNRDYVKKVYQVNERKFQGASQFKPLEKAFFRQFAIPTPTYFGTLHEQWGCTPDGSPLRSPADLQRCLAPLAGKKVCFKLVEGASGKGFKAYQVLAQSDPLILTHPVSGDRHSIEELFDLLVRESREGWLLEEHIEQHPVLKAFNPTSLNTVRMFLYKKRNGEVISLRSFLKTGRPGALIDKTENGGASVFVNEETGVLQNGFNWSPEMRPLAQHPGSKLKFEGVQLPFWKEARDMAIGALRAFPGTRFVGVDVAITENGPVMIEMNVQPDAECMAVLRLPTATLFDS